MQPIRDYYRRLQGFNPNARLHLLFSLLSGLCFSIYFLFFNLYILSMAYCPSWGYW